MSPKPKYQLKHEYLRELIPKETYELADSLVDHLGEIISKTDPLELIGFILGINLGLDLELEPKQILLSGASGAMAIRGLSSNSEAIGIASLATLIAMGSNFVVPIPESAVEKIDKIRERKAELAEILSLPIDPANRIAEIRRRKERFWKEVFGEEK